MKYKYMELDIEGSKELAEKFKDIKTCQEIYEERVEVLEKAKAFDRIKDEGDYASDAEEYVNIVSDIVEKFGGQK